MILTNLIPPQYKLLATLVAFIGALALGGAIGNRLTSIYYSNEISNIKLEISKENEKRLNELVASLEIMRKQSDQADKNYDEALTQIEKLKHTPKPTNRLFDPGSHTICPNTLSGSNLHEDTPESRGTELSREAGGFLQRESDRADEAIRRCNAYIKEAYHWASQQK
jgi:hypothetical protein